MDKAVLTHLQRLESEAIHIMREVVAETENPVMLYSVGERFCLHVACRKEGFLSFTTSVPIAPCRHDMEVPRDVRNARQSR